VSSKLQVSELGVERLELLGVLTYDLEVNDRLSHLESFPHRDGGALVSVRRYDVIGRGD
jgi:hypothetical protein